MTRTTRPHCAACALLLLAAAGCMQQNHEGNGTVYSYLPWVAYAAGAGGLLAIPAGLFLLRKSKFWGIVFLLVGPLFTVFVAPSFSFDRVVVDPDHFEMRVGFWFSPTEHNVRFADVAQIVHREEVRYSRGRRNYSYYLDCTKKQGGVEIVPVGDVMKEARHEILQRAAEHGIAISERRAP